MPDRAIDVRLFRYALASAEHGSFRRAAAALNVQQSTVSKGIRNLEYRVGVPLFERSHAGIRATSAGRRFLEEAGLGFDHLTRAMQRIGALQRGEHGELTIAASTPFGLVGDVLGAFREVQPGVSLEMVEGTCDASLAMVQQRRADIAFITKPPGDSAGLSMRLRDVPLFAVLSIAHRLAGAQTASLEELRSERLMLSAGGMGPELADHLNRRMTKSGGPLDLQLHRVGQCDLVNMVARGFGVTIVVGQLTRTPPDDVVLIPLAGRNAVTIHAVWLESNPNPALNGLLKIARQIAP